MTIEEIKAKLPEADVYALDPNFRYIIVVDKRNISVEITRAIGEHIKTMTGHAPVVISVLNKADALTLLEVKP